MYVCVCVVVVVVVVAIVAAAVVRMPHTTLLWKFPFTRRKYSGEEVSRIWYQDKRTVGAM